ncbi:putative type II secretion system protein H precursor [compost metagenome]
MVQARGFTLVEVLVVVVIMGVLAGAVMLAGGARGDAYQLREEAERFGTVVRLVADEAVLDNREYGIQLSTQGYGIRRHDGRSGRWLPVPDWAPHRLPAGMQFSIAVEGAPLQLPNADTGDERPPQILLSSSAQWTPFHARIHAGEGSARGYRIDSDGMNDPQVSEMLAP